MHGHVRIMVTDNSSPLERLTAPQSDLPLIVAPHELKPTISTSTAAALNIEPC
jgi:hypothetical protein